MELAMRNMERLREKFTHRTVLGLGEFDWVVVRFMLTTAYSAQVRKVNDMEFKISVGKENGEDAKWAEFRLKHERVRLAAWKEAMTLLNENVESASQGFGWGKDLGDADSRDLYEGRYGG